MANETITIKLTGIAGACKGKEYLIEEGGEAVIGRSRDCTIRVGDSDAPDKPGKGTGGAEDHLHTVSRHHVKISFQGAKAIYIEDLSKHGTFLNGHKVEGRDQIIGMRKAPIELRLGTNETFRMEMLREPAKLKPKITVKRREG